MPDTDLFFKNLFALGMVGYKSLQNVWVFNPDKTLEKRYEEFLGPTSLHKFKFNPKFESNEIPDKYDLPEGYLLNSIYSIASRYYLEEQFPGNGDWVI